MMSQHRTYLRNWPMLVVSIALSACRAVDGDVPRERSLDVTVQQGALHGVLKDSTRVFLGVPYAAPPTSDNRFRSPQPPASWTGVRSADTYGPPCPQFSLTGQFDSAASEDCLSLNVWAPQRIGKGRPVMFFVHGGGFSSGSGNEPLYDGQHLSEAGNVVVVTINYRLGPLGFLAHPAFQAEDPSRGGSGNWGLEDQQFALRWVRENIAAFGGDPENVMLFGESAGGMSVCTQLVSPRSAGLFQKAAIESGPCVVFNPPSQAAADQQGEALASAVGCTDTDAAGMRSCLRAKSAVDILRALPLRAEIIFGEGYSWVPNVDGYVLPDTPAKLLANNSFHKMPLLVGANEDEGTLFVQLGLKLKTEQEVRDALSAMYSQPMVDTLLAHYSPLDEHTGLRILGDAFVCDARHVSRIYAAAAPTYYYHFTRAFQWIFPNLGVFHTAELPFVFDNPYIQITTTDEERPLVEQMQGYWTRFATAGDPNTGAPAGTVAWPAYSPQSDMHLRLDLSIEPGSGLRREACDFWDGLLQ